jgi:hypothetical protein
VLRATVALLVLMLLASGAQAQKRVALVIGNSAYQHTTKLTNPKNDASDVVAALKKLGLQVLADFDLDKASFDRKVRDFATALQGAEAGVFFFAGHGMQVGGTNYLIPVDAELKTASALDFEMVRLEVVQRVMENETQTNILFLDACRDNPLARNLARTLGTRSGEIGRGFAPAVSGVGTLISFSTQPGNVALDGTGRNSPFAGALAKRLVATKDDLSAILIDVRNDVMQETQNKQVPWEHSALRGRFYFNPMPLSTEPPKTELTSPPIADGPDAQPNARARLGSIYDGPWQVEWHNASGCSDPHALRSLVVSKNIVSSPAGVTRPVTGKVDTDGKITFSHPGVMKGVTVRYSGQLTENSGSGRFTGHGSCAGTFTATRR